MPNLRTPLYQWHIDHQARMVPFAGWDMPVQYDGVVAEHKAVRTSAGIFDISHMGRLSFGGEGGGRDVPQLLERVFTNSVASMKDCQVRYGLVCREDGGILDDILVYRWMYGLAAVVNASNREKIIGWLKENKGNLSFEIADRTFETAMIALQGPNALAMMGGLFADDVGRLKYYYSIPTRYRNKACVVSRTGYTGEDGFEVMVANALAIPLWEELIARGATPCGLGARDTLRLEAAMPLYGHELSEAINPIQAGLEWAVKLGKGDFIGLEAIRRASNLTLVQPLRVGLEVDGARAARENSTILNAAGERVGVVTSGSFCPWLEKSLAMGYLEPQLAAPGTRVQIDVRGSRLDAAVVPLPFYKRKKAIM
jgi:aminomethyltransferase